MEGKHREPETTKVLQAGLAAQRRQAEKVSVPKQTVEMLLKSTGNK